MKNNITVDTVLNSLRTSGTQGTLLSICESLTKEQEERFHRFYVIIMTRMLEKVERPLAGDEHEGENILKRGMIAEMIIRSYEYATNVTGKDTINSEYICPLCKSECGVIELTTDKMKLRCRNKACKHEYTKGR